MIPADAISAHVEEYPEGPLLYYPGGWVAPWSGEGPVPEGAIRACLDERPCEWRFITNERGLHPSTGGVHPEPKRAYYPRKARA
jgi:hypothetical protein